MKTEEKNLGKVSITPEGEYKNNKEYDRLSLVTILNDNKVYLSKKKVPSSIAIDNSEY